MAGSWGLGGGTGSGGRGRRGPGESQAGEGVIFSGNCSFLWEGAEDTHVPCHKLTHVYTHALCTCKHDWRLGAEDFRFVPLAPSIGMLVFLLFCGLWAFFQVAGFSVGF